MRWSKAQGRAGQGRAGPGTATGYFAAMYEVLEANSDSSMQACPDAETLHQVAKRPVLGSL